MFEIIKLCLLVALMLSIGNASMYLEEVDYCSFHQQVTCCIAVLDFFMVMIPGLILAIITLSSNKFPQGFSNVMTAVIIVEFVYMLFVYGKVIPDYLSSGEVVPKTKDTIKID